MITKLAARLGPARLPLGFMVLTFGLSLVRSALTDELDRLTADVAALHEGVQSLGERGPDQGQPEHDGDADPETPPVADSPPWTPATTA